METATVTVVDLRDDDPSANTAALAAVGQVANGSVSNGSATGAGQDSALDDRDRQILAFERQWYKFAGGKEQALLDQFGMSPTRYFQVLNALIDRPEALAHDPMLVKRLRRMRQFRQQARSSARRGNL